MHRIGRRDSATCPHSNGADEMAEHLVLHCPVHDQAQHELWPNLHYQSYPDACGEDRGSDPTPTRNERGILQKLSQNMQNKYQAIVTLPRDMLI